MTESFVQSSLRKEDPKFEVPLRPAYLSEFIGQDDVKKRLEISICAAKQRKEPLGHCLFSGPPGLGKTTFASILAKEMGTQMITTSGPVIEKAGDLAGVLTSLQKGDVLFIDEIHRLGRDIVEYLYPAMEDFVLDLMIDSGPSARSVRVKLNQFTLVGATTNVGVLTSPLRSRFVLTSRLDYYDVPALEKVVARTALLLDLDLDPEAITEVARCARGTPRVVNNLLRWIRDYAQVEQHAKVSRGVVRKALCILSIDEKGLDEMDKKILSLIIDHYSGGPVGLGTIAVALGEEKSTVEEVYEPYLIMQGLLKRTTRGREVTSEAYRYLSSCRT